MNPGSVVDMAQERKESPRWLQTSTAGAITLGLEPGSFFRDAKLHCLNLLLTYDVGCKASCSFCGLNHARAGFEKSQEKTFIRVKWPAYRTSEIARILQSSACKAVHRACISMVTHPRAKGDTLSVVDELSCTGKNISVLVAPTVIDVKWLDALRNTKVDKVGIAIDAATRDMFDAHRGKGVKGPHSWDHYWKIFHAASSVFGGQNTGIHLIIGLGETERDAISVIQRVHDAGSDTHLFSFFPEPGSREQSRPQPSIGKYRRVQLARELIHRGLANADGMEFNEYGQVTGLGAPGATVDAVIDQGIAFMTQGCKETDGFISCNRPYSNCTPFQAATGEWRKFPFPPTKDDIRIITRQLADFNEDSWVRTLDETDDFLLDEPCG